MVRVAVLIFVVVFSLPFAHFMAGFYVGLGLERTTPMSIMWAMFITTFWHALYPIREDKPK